MDLFAKRGLLPLGVAKLKDIPTPEKKELFPEGLNRKKGGATRTSMRRPLARLKEKRLRIYKE